MAAAAHERCTTPCSDADCSPSPPRWPARRGADASQSTPSERWMAGDGGLRSRSTIMADEFLCETAEVRHFIRTVQAIVAGTATVDTWLTAIRPHFPHPQADPTWLPDAFRRVGDGGGMGRGIANWLLYRDTAGTLSLSALVLA